MNATLALMSKTPELPECLSVIICDEIYRDEVSKKLILVGVFNVIKAAAFPAKHPRMTVLFTLTNGQGTYDMSLSLEHASTGAAIAEIKGPLKLQNPLEIVDFNVELGGLQFPEPGKYWVIVKIDGAIINQRPFVVVQAEASQ